MHELVALFHYHNAVGVERYAGLAVAGVSCGAALTGDEQQRFVGHGALGVDADKGAGILLLVVLFFVEGDAVVVRHLAAAALPDGNHAVYRLVLGDDAVVVLGLAFVVGFAGLEALLPLNVHLYRPADIVGVLLDKRLDFPCLEVGAVQLLVGVVLDVHDDVGADALALTWGDGVAVRAGAFPFDALLLAVLAGDNGDLIGDHEGRVEADAELTDDGDVLALGLFGVKLALELIGAALGDDAEVVLGFLLSHADAVVAHGDGALVLVDDDVDMVVGAAETDLVVGQRQVAQLVDSVGCVGDYFAQEDFFIGVNRVDHQVKQTLGFCLELFLSHSFGASSNYNFSNL